MSLDAVAEAIPELAVPSDQDSVDHRLRVERALRGLPADATVRKFFSRLLSALRLVNEN